MIKKFNKFNLKEKNEIDPFDEDIWEERDIENSEILYLSVEYKTYDNGEPLQIPWTGKNFVLLEDKGKYYKIGEIRFTKSEFFMFYVTSGRNIENGMLNQYHGKILRKLNNKEKKQVVSTLNKEFKMDKNINNPNKTYLEILNYMKL